MQPIRYKIKLEWTPDAHEVMNGLVDGWLDHEGCCLLPNKDRSDVGSWPLEQAAAMVGSHQDDPDLLRATIEAE